MPVFTRLLGLSGVLVLGMACGGGGDDGGTDPPSTPVIVTVTPAHDTITAGVAVQLTSSVTGSSNTGVTWSVVGAPAAGSVDSDGLYQSATSGLVRVVASSEATPVGRDTALILVVDAPGTTLTVADSAAQGLPVTASAPAVGGATYLWTAVGGTIATGQGTATVSITPGSGATLSVGCTVRNLADSAVTTTRQVTLVAPPSIVSFTALRDTITVGEGTSIVAAFTGGTAVVSEAVGVVTSGTPVAVGPFTTGYAGTTFTLTVTGFRGSTRTAQVRVVSANPPALNLFRLMGPKAPVGGHGQFLASWYMDPAVVASIAPDIGRITSGFVSTPPLIAPGTIKYTFAVRSPADSILTDTLSLIVVTPAPGAFSTVVTGKPRLEHTATAMADGRVLLAGGRIFSQTLVNGSVDIFDPLSGTLSSTDSLLINRSGHVAALLQDGRVFVAGGDSPGLANSSELYDPTTGHWTLGPSLSKTPLAAATLSDGRVLLILREGEAAVFDPATGIISATGSPIGAQSEMSLLTLGNGRALMAGGTNANVPVRRAQIYDGATGLFTLTGELHFGHWQGAFVRLADGRVLAAGGWDDFIQHRSEAGEVFDPVTGLWAIVGKLAMPRHVPEATLLTDGRVLLASGLDGWGDLAAFAEIFDPATGQFTPTLGNLGFPTTLGRLTSLANGKALWSGGVSNSESSGILEVFSP